MTRAVLCSLVIGLLTTAAATWQAQAEVVRQFDRRLDQEALEAQQSLEGVVQLKANSLTQLRNHLQTTQDTSAANFERFVGLGMQDGLYEQVQAVTFNRFVRDEDLDAYERERQAAMLPSTEQPPFSIHPASDRPDHYVVEHIVPYAGNEAALGLDVATDDSRRAAFEAARDTGRVVSTAPITLVQGSASPEGVLLMRAVYDQPEDPRTAPARRRHLVGFVVAVVRTGDLLTNVLDRASLVDIEVYDVGRTVDPPASSWGPGDLVLDSDPATTTAGSGGLPAESRTIDINVGDRRWRAIVTPSPLMPRANWLLVMAVAVAGLAISGLLVLISLSVTRAREQAEELASSRKSKLQAAEERFRLLVDRSPDATVLVARDGTIELASQRVRTLTGHVPEDLVGMPIEALVPDWPQIPAMATAMVGADTTEIGPGVELGARHVDGHEVPVEVSLAPVTTADGEPILVAAFRDTTMRRETRLALESALERQEAATEQLARTDELRTRFLETVSHELRTPLTAIVGFTDLLLSPEGIDEEAQHAMLVRVDRNAHHLTGLITDLLEFTRLERGAVEVEPEDIDLGRLVDQVCGQLDTVLSSNVIVVDHPDEELHVQADPRAMVRVLTNLLMNATRYAPAGSTITIGLRHNETTGELTVSDEGPGIPEHERELVFERFYRGRSRAVMARPGSGVGLSVVRELLHLQSGTVSIADDPPPGTTMIVTVPLARQRVAAPATSNSVSSTV